MPRRKLYKILAKDTSIYDVIVSELQKNPELAADYDMNSIESKHSVKYVYGYL
jgi:hypothetical protein